MSTVPSSYREWVQSKAAPPYTISVLDFHLLHAGLGLATEMLELDISHTRANTIEELEDILWYMTYLSNVMSLDSNCMNIILPKDINALTNVQTKLILKQKMEELISQIKKHVIYRKHRDLTEPYAAVWLAFLNHCAICKVSVKELMHGNRMKLDERYAAGFTSQESEDRRDKA